MKKIEKMESILYFLVGLFSTWMAIMIPIGNSLFGVYNFIALGLIVFEFFKNRKIYFNQKLFLLFCFLAIISTIGSRIIINDIWFLSSLRATLKFLIIIVPFLVFVDNASIIKNRKYLIKGLFYSAIVQLAWEFLEIILWSMNEISLNKIVFQDLLNFDIGRNWLFWSDGRMRPTGLSWEPANLGLSLIIGFILCKNKFIKILFSLGIILSTSRISLGVFLVIIFIDLIKKGIILYKIKGKNGKFNLNVRNVIIYIIFLVMFILLFIIFTQKISFFNYIYKNIESTIYTIIHISDNPSANRHFEYYLRLPELYLHLNLFEVLFGFGITCAGYPYARYLNIYSVDTVWTPETDYISILLGNGLIGFIIYYYWIYKIIKNNKSNFKTIKIIISILLITTMSQFFRGWVSLLLIFFAANLNDGEKNTNELSQE